MLVILIYQIKSAPTISNQKEENEYFEIFKNIVIGKINFEREKDSFWYKYEEKWKYFKWWKLYI